VEVIKQMYIPDIRRAEDFSKRIATDVLIRYHCAMKIPPLIFLLAAIQQIERKNADQGRDQPDTKK